MYFPPTDTVCIQSESDITNSFTEEQQTKKIHHYILCKKRDCLGVSQEERARIKTTKKKQMFNHSLIFNKDLAYSPKVQMWWLVYIEGEGQYCLICKKFDSKNPQNKKEFFSAEPSTRLKKDCLEEHIATKRHKDAITAILMNRFSVFQIELDHNAEVQVDVYERVFYCLYWLAKEDIANVKVKSLLKLVAKLGCDMSGFNHTSVGSFRNMLLLLGEMIQNEVISAVTGPFGVMVDDMTDIANLEQMIGFIQYYNRGSEKVEVKFLCLENVLASSDAADSLTITSILLEVIEKHSLNFDWFKSFVSDGASVMVGERSGVATRLKADERIQSLISVHCVCHKLALACTDTLNDLATIKKMQNTLNTLWQLLDNSNKKTAIFLKVQLEVSEITLSNKNSQKKIAKKLKKACQTRWLSFNAAVQSAWESFSAIIQFLIRMKDEDPTCQGLLVQMNNVRFLACLYVLKHVLPVLDNLSKSFQHSTVNFSHLKPEIVRAKAALDEVATKEVPIKQFCQDIKEGKMVLLQFSPSEHQLASMRNLLLKYVSALKENIDLRFQNTLPLLGALSIFDPTLIPASSSELPSYGVDSIQVLAKHYFPDQQDRLLAEWNILKYHMKEMAIPADVKEGKTTMPAEWCMSQLMKQRSSFLSLLPLLMHIVEIALTMPISNAWPERGVSRVKLIKSRLRSRLTNEMLEALVNISMNGPEANSSECDTLVKKTTEKWLSGKRYNLAKGKSASRESKGKEPAPPELTSVSTQTDPQVEDRQSQEEQQALQEEEQALIKLGLANFQDDPSCDDSDRDSAMGESDFSDSDF